MDNAFAPPETDVEPRAEDQRGLRLASRWARLGGAIIDTIIMIIPAVGLAFALGLYDGIGADGQMPLDKQLLGAALGIGVYLIINGWTIYSRGQTLGKMAVGIRVVTLGGEQISGNKYVLARLLPIWVVSQLPFIGSILGLVDALLIFRSEKNCLHDDIAQSRVVSVR